ncbi:MAG: ATP-binding protein [Bacteroidales bacterium]|nr:ATP-binding protein [Bacteroidales bacterium]
MNEIPLWLDLKKEYVDDNFVPLLNYLYKARLEKDHDLFYETTLNLFNDRCSDLLKEIESYKMFAEEPDTDTLDFNIRLLTASLIVATSPERAKEIFIALLLQLHLRFPDLSDKIIEKAGKALRAASIGSPGVTFRDVIHYKPAIFVHMVIDHAQISDPMDNQMIFEECGRAWLNCSGLILTATGATLKDERHSKFAYSLETPVGCRIGTSSADKLKFNDAQSHSAAEWFINDFINRQRQPLKVEESRRVRSLSPGDHTVVEITHIAYNGRISVATVDPNIQPLKGIIEFREKSVALYKTDILYKNLRVGNRLSVTYTGNNGSQALFNFERQLLRFLVEDMRSEYPDADAGSFMALMKIAYRNYAYWLTARGVGVCTYVDERYKPGDVAMLRIHNYDYGPNYGKINAEIVGDVEEEDFNPILDFDEHEVRFDAIQAFVDSTPEVAEPENIQPEEPKIPRGLLALLPRLFYVHQKELRRPSERLKYLANARVLAELLGDHTFSEFLKFTMTYLRGVVAFADGMPMDDLNPEPAPDFKDTHAVRLRLSILDLLKEYGRKDYSELLFRTIEQATDEEADPLLPKLARLIQAANSVQDTLSPASLNIIKREIIQTLSIDNEDDVDLEADGRAYIGMENQTMEFKSSMVFPPDYNMQPNQIQQTHNVFRAICGFLNSTTGGTVYLGVSDSGYVIGLDQDFQFLKCGSIDSYTRVHILDPLIREFGEDVMNYIHIDTAYDDKVIVIRVESHPFRVVELGDVAYQRFDRETREMSDRTKAELMAKKVLRDRNKAASIIQLQHAMSKRRVAVVKSYADEGGGLVADLRVEPYKVMPEEGLALCLDCESMICRPLRISRIGYVEVDESSRWTYSHLHRPIPVDAFHAYGDSDMEISLQLDYYAKTRMLEEYPRTRENVSPCKGDSNVWYYHDTVRSPEGVGRFYISLADHIRILDAPGLEQWASTFARENIR